jgi:hypothetical protein
MSIRGLTFGINVIFVDPEGMLGIDVDRKAEYHQKEDFEISPLDILEEKGPFEV